MLATETSPNPPAHHVGAPATRRRLPPSVRAIPEPNQATMDELSPIVAKMRLPNCPWPWVWPMLAAWRECARLQHNAFSGARALLMGLARVAKLMLAWMGLWRRRVRSNPPKKAMRSPLDRPATGGERRGHADRSQNVSSVAELAEDHPPTPTAELGALPPPGDLNLATCACDSGRLMVPCSPSKPQTRNLDGIETDGPAVPRLAPADTDTLSQQLPSDAHDRTTLPDGVPHVADPVGGSESGGLKPSNLPPEAQAPARGRKHDRADSAPVSRAPEKTKKSPIEAGGRRRVSRSRPILGTSPARSPRPELMCRRNGVQWEVFLSAPDECQVSDVRHDEELLDRKDGKYGLLSFAGCLTVTFGERQDIQLPLADRKPLIFKLRTDWRGAGRRIDRLTHGHFIVIAPHDWTREGHVPVEPQDCTDAAFRAHFFHRTKDGVDDMAFKQCRIPLSGALVSLQGDKVFDDSDEGLLFGGKAPPTLADVPSVVWARVGQEGDGGWRGENFRPAEQALAEVLAGRQGRFFVRVYDEEAKLLDSDEFRYFRCLEAIHVNGEPYTEQSVLAPGPVGHLPTNVRFVGADAGMTLTCPTDHARVDGERMIVEPLAEADVVSCVSETEQVGIELHLPRIWWGVDWMAKSIGDFNEWLDQPTNVTRQQFTECAERGATLHLRLPRRFKGARIGFDDEQGGLYKAKTTESVYSSLMVRLEDFCLHRQIDQRLNGDAFLCVEIDEEKLPLVRVLRDPMPKIVQFSCHPVTILRGERLTLCWNTQDTETDGVAIEPDIGPVPPKGTCDVMPSTDSSYTLRLTASGADDVTANIKVTVQAKQDQRVTATLIAYVRRRHGRLGPGRGFSYGELRAASMTVLDAKRRLIRLDKRRQTTHTTNVAVLEGLTGA